MNKTELRNKRMSVGLKFQRGCLGMRIEALKFLDFFHSFSSRKKGLKEKNSVKKSIELQKEYFLYKLYIELTS